ncbi:HdeD family acid-resistance protein [Rhizohabitans arisaemae]|uniref:HdeD family acid-resistance protein n=1 Tax=Rhizohabitans arisaemae TaxID=2720610 RepID=UPI0024B13429|nr:HdeD family acid-resistance protein [Rhizohabitans arisaemae]
MTWWLLTLRGLLAILFGLLALFWPGITVLALVLMFGFFALVEGIFRLVAAFGRAGRESRWLLVLGGVVGIAIGLITLFWPGITAIVLLVLIAVWAILTGLFEIIAAVALRREISNVWLLALAGAFSFVFGIFMIALPRQGAIAVVWLIGIYAIVFGIAMVVFSLRFRGLVYGTGTRSTRV